MLSKAEKQQVLHLLQAPQWGTLERVAELVCDTIRGERTVYDSEWETMRATLLKEGRITGIREFIQELYKKAQEAHE